MFDEIGRMTEMVGKAEMRLDGMGWDEMGWDRMTE
jgi:hypothetical protein